LKFKLFGGLPFSIVSAVAPPSLTIPYYHVVSDADLLHVKHLYAYKGVRAFTDDLEFLLAHYTPIGLADLLDQRRTGRRLPRRALLLTFDDGYREMADVVAPILLEKGVPATFFVNTAFLDNQDLCYLNKASLLIDALERASSPHLERRILERFRANAVRRSDATAAILAIDYRSRWLLDDLAAVTDVDFDDYLRRQRPYLSSADIRWLLARGFTIGGHSVDHPRYAALSLDEQLRQTIDSVAALKRAFKLGHGAFAFPHTDRGVTREFFDRLAVSGGVDLCFGTAGLIDERIATLHQRVSLELPLERAERILTFHHARRVQRMITTRSTAWRN
jgi:peptidoglycan/xylan/chitin deacetylase (PgdA/CDA1 family)